MTTMRFIIQHLFNVLPTRLAGSCELFPNVRRTIPVPPFYAVRESNINTLRFRIIGLSDYALRACKWDPGDHLFRPRTCRATLPKQVPRQEPWGRNARNRETDLPPSDQGPVCRGASGQAR